MSQPVHKGRKQPKLPQTTAREELLVDGSDLLLRRVIDHLSTLSWLLEKIRGVLAQLVGVSPFQYKLLQTIARLPGDPVWSVGALARHFHVTDAYVSTEVAGLISRQLVTSETNPADKRGRIVTATKEAHEVLATVALAQQRANDQTYSQFDARSLVRFEKVIRRMIDDAEAANGTLESIVFERDRYARGAALLTSGAKRLPSSRRHATSQRGHQG